MIKSTIIFKYVEVAVTLKGNNKQEIKVRIKQAKTATKQLSSVL